MWIIPKNLQLSSGAPDTAAFISDLNEQSQICASSLMARSKASPARTWLQKWKRDSWTQHLSGRILRPSRARTFVTEWVSLLPVTPVSHFQQRGSDSEQKTLGTSGHTSPDQYELFDLDYASLRMSKDTSALDSEKSLENWNQSVTKRRGEYSQRLKLARRIKESASSSWPTVTTQDSYNTPCASQMERNTPPLVVAVHGPLALVSSSLHGSRQGLSWATPAARDTQGQRGAAANARKGNPLDTLPNQMAQWGTPTARDHKSGRGNEEREYKELTPMVERTQSGKLNPRWVETLMGLPVGWVMPSCASPVIIELTNCDSSATESCLPPQSEPSELFGRNSND